MSRVPRLPLALVSIAAVAAIAIWQWYAGREVPGVGDLPHRLENLGRVVVVADGALGIEGREIEGTTLVPSSEIAGLDAALEGDEAALAAALDAAHLGGLVIDGRAPRDASDTSVRARLSRYEPMELFSCSYLAPSAALYLPRSELVIGPPMDAAVAHVARSIISGARPPRVHSFPEPLRRIRSVEVMVMLEEPGGRPRLWRSARGSSIARALLTASIVARQRWTEREAARGGSIDDAVRDLDIAVYLLDEDGTLGARTAAFVDHVFSPEHGVAFDDHGTWRYLLPEATREEGEGSAVRAYRALFSESDMSPDSLGREDVRLYRMLARLIARSPAPHTTRAARPPIVIEGADLFDDDILSGRL